MRWLNYHHLYYFWHIAKAGSISQAASELKLSQPTISAQLKALEDMLGEQLFFREGRALKLTETGHLALRYAEEIFGLGRELLDVIDGRPTGKPLELRIGIADNIPKAIAYHLIQPATGLKDPLRLICIEDRTEKLLAELALQSLDLVITDSPVPGSVKIKAFNHLLGECGVALLGVAERVKELKRGFPDSLTGARVLLPLANMPLRREIDRWFESAEIRPDIVGEFQDSALMKSFAQAGLGLVPVPTVIENEVCAQYGLKRLGLIPGITERYYAISIERKVKHPAVSRICEEARSELFHK